MLLLILTVVFGGHALSFSDVHAARIVPNTLTIVGTQIIDDGLGNSGGGFFSPPPEVHITDIPLVHVIYQDLLALPAESTHTICPLYIKASYHLWFSHDTSSLLTANVQQGGCSTVTLGQGDIRATNTYFERLLASAIGQTAPSHGLTPSDLQKAYSLPSASNGKGQTVAIVDAYDNPNAEADMNIYRSYFDLPPCTTKNGCFKKVDERGDTHYPDANTGWAEEIALDLDMVSAICPNCHILLVEAKEASFADLGGAVDTAVHLGARVVSNSYGSPENAQLVQSAARYYNHPGVILTASSGDFGSASGVQLPAAFKSVVAVGGTSLFPDRVDLHNTRHLIETTWNGTGSGCSKYINKPAWQKNKGCKKRTIPDVSAVGDPDTGVAVYNTNSWEVVGGTSVSSPIIAGIYALAENATKIDGSYLYSHAANLYTISDVGSNPLGAPNGIGAF